MVEGVDPAWVESVAQEIERDYYAEGRRMYFDLAVAFAVEMAMKNRLILMGFEPGTQEFIKGLDSMKNSLLDSWRSKLIEVHENQGRATKVKISPTQSVEARELGVDMEAVFKSALSRLEVGFRINLSMPPRAEDFSTMFKDIDDLENMEGPPL